MLGHIPGHEDEELEVSQRWPSGQARANDERTKHVAGQGRGKDRRRKGGDGGHRGRVCGRYDGAGTGGDRDGGVRSGEKRMGDVGARVVSKGKSGEVLWGGCQIPGRRVPGHQEDYIQDVLDRNGVKGVASTPMSRDLSDPGPEENITAEEVQAAQRIVGELMWLVTRCRVDLAYTVAKMASQVARTPRWVVQVGEQALKYLNGAKEEGLLFSVDTGTDLNGRVGAGLEVATDASFAPGGGLSHGCVMVKWMGSVVA